MIRIVLIDKGSQVALKLESILLLYGYTVLNQDPNVADLRSEIEIQNPNLIINLTNIFEDRINYDDFNFDLASCKIDKAIFDSAMKTNAPIIYLSTAAAFDEFNEFPCLEYDKIKKTCEHKNTKINAEIANYNKNLKSLIIETSLIFSENNKILNMIAHSVLFEDTELLDSLIISPIYIEDFVILFAKIINKLIHGTENKEIFGIFRLTGKPPTTPFRFFNAANRLMSVKPNKKFSKIVYNFNFSKDPSVQEYVHESYKLDCGWIYLVYGIEQPDWQIGLRSCMEKIILNKFNMNFD